MEKNGYSNSTITALKKCIRFILANKNNSWANYSDILNDYLSLYNHSLCSHKCIINTVANFDLNNHFPNGWPSSIFAPKAAYDCLNIHFKEAVDLALQKASGRGNSSSSILGKKYSFSAFLYKMQQNGCNDFSEITEDMIIDFFTNGGNKLRSRPAKEKVVELLNNGLGEDDPDRKRLLAYVPRINKRRKNIQYLTDDEIERIKDIVTSEDSICTRDKAIIFTMLYTGLRVSDIAGMMLSDLDWENDRIYLYQEKTNEPHEIPIRPVFGNYIWDYIVHERGDVDCNIVFLSKTRPYRGIKPHGIGSILNRIYTAAGIRMNKEDRRGGHILRHNYARANIENGASHATISSLMGHMSPKSLDAYTNTDFIHLKEVALSISNFPLSKEVFEK